MIDTLTFGNCLNAFATVEDLLAFLVAAQPEELRLVLDRETEAYSAGVLAQPVDAWQPENIALVRSFVESGGVAP